MASMEYSLSAAESIIAKTGKYFIVQTTRLI